MFPARATMAALTLLCLLCPPTGQAVEPIQVAVSVLPQRYFVQQIAQDLVKVQVMVAPGASPATYEPRPQQMKTLTQTKLYFAVGVPFERVWLEKIRATNPGMTIVQTDAGIDKRSMHAHHHEEPHAHDSAAKETSGHDPHIWLSPPLVKIQAKTIMEALVTCDPAHREVYQTQYQRFLATIDTLDRDLKSDFATLRGLRFMVFHPSWGYFADAYGLTQVPIELEGKHPKPAQLQALIQDARQKAIKVVFVQPQFSTKSAQLIAREIGAQVAVADPLAEDWITNLRAVAAQFKAALK